MGSITTEEAISILQSKLTNTTKILNNDDAQEFKESMKRWSDTDVKIPAAILKPSCEGDLVKIVSHAIENQIPIVAKAGGHSPWSTVASPGWITDLSLLTSITINPSKTNPTATIQAGVLTKPLNKTISNAGYKILSAGASTVGYIPFLLGGGTSWYTGLHGLACDHLLSVRIITSKRGLITVSATENADLFWALKGAGHFFGIVTEVTVRIFPERQGEETLAWTLIFKPEKVDLLARVLEGVVGDGRDERLAGMIAVMAAPGSKEPIIVVNTMHFQRTETKAQKIMDPLLTIGPIQQIKKIILFENITDAADALNVQAGLKTQISCGMQRFDGEKFRRSLGSWKELVSEYPSAAGSFFMFNWYGVEAMRRVVSDVDVDVDGDRDGDHESAYTHRDCRVWSMSFVSATDEKSALAAVENAEAFMKMCQEDQEESERAIFPNHSRSHAIEMRYRGESVRRRLSALNKTWDPEGFFTRQFL